MTDESDESDDASDIAVIWKATASVDIVIESYQYYRDTYHQYCHSSLYCVFCF